VRQGALAAARTVKQNKFTDMQIEGFTTAQSDMPSVTEKIEDSAAHKAKPVVQDEQSVVPPYGFTLFGLHGCVCDPVCRLV
jgi:hypothetical protein